MWPKYLSLVLLYISSVFFTKAQDQEKAISANKKFLPNSINSSIKKLQTAPDKDTVPCYCSVSTQITRIVNQETSKTYQGIPNAFCYPLSSVASPGTGSLNINSNFVDTCGVSSVTYSWSIISGNNIA